MQAYEVLEISSARWTNSNFIAGPLFGGILLATRGVNPTRLNTGAQRHKIRVNYMEKSIAYVGEFDFPLGDPGSIRVLSNGKIFRDIGYDVSFFCHKGSKSLQPVSGEYQGFYFSKKINSQ